MNSFGGDIFLGVTDDGKVVGVPEGEVEPIKRHIVNVASDPHKQIGRADELGSGTRNLYHYVRLYSGVDPIMDEEDVFSITIPLNAAHSPEVEGCGASVNSLKSGLESTLESTLKSTLKNTDEKLVEIILSTPAATIPIMQEKLGITRDGVNKALKRLKSKGIIRRVGPDKGGHWEVLK